MSSTPVLGIPYQQHGVEPRAGKLLDNKSIQACSPLSETYFKPQTLCPDH